MKGYNLVTVCNRFPTEPYYTLKQFIKSCEREEILVLGTQPGEYIGLGSKPKLLYQAIKEGKIKEKVLIFCDCWDMVFACPPHMVFWNFLDFKSPVVISSERNCFPDTYKKEYDELPFTSSFKYLNSGMICGETDAILAMLEAMNLDKVPDDYYDEKLGKMIHINDQEQYQEIFIKQPVEIKLDYNQILCQTLHDVNIEDLDFSDVKIKNKETGTYPLSFHFNGCAKTNGLREPILKHLNHDIK